MIDAGIATPEDVDAAVRFGFGFRFLAAGPVLQRDHAGIDVHCAAAATMYPSLAASTVPAQALTERVARRQARHEDRRGLLPLDARGDRRRAQRATTSCSPPGLKLLAAELPPIDDGSDDDEGAPPAAAAPA